MEAGERQEGPKIQAGPGRARPLSVLSGPHCLHKCGMFAMRMKRGLRGIYFKDRSDQIGW